MRNAAYTAIALAALIARASGEDHFDDLVPLPSAPAAGHPAATPQAAPAPAPATNGLAASGTNSAILAELATASYVADDKYKLRAGDRLSFQILEDRIIDDKDAPKSLLVSDSGEVDVPYLGRLVAADKTCKQLADEMKADLEKTYYYRATVILSLDLANKYLGRCYVWGQVRNQGPVEMSVGENLTAGKAILRAGGFADFANKKKVKVVRSGGSDPKARLNFELNMVEILEKGKTEKDVLLQPDDFVIVPSRLINF
jgi:protein involved in polysaccharide export with SLBB domain